MVAGRGGSFQLPFRRTLSCGALAGSSTSSPLRSQPCARVSAKVDERTGPKGSGLPPLHSSKLNRAELRDPSFLHPLLLLPCPVLHVPDLCCLRCRPGGWTRSGGTRLPCFSLLLASVCWASYRGEVDSGANEPVSGSPPTAAHKS